MEKKIVGFHVDDQGDWVADLECGHGQHVRHNPPWTNRPWVLEQQERERFLGEVLDCLKCNMPMIPVNAVQFDCSEIYDQAMLIAQYSGVKTNDAGIWIKLVISEGELIYQQVSGETKGYVIDSDFAAVIAPGERFALRTKGHVLCQFYYFRDNKDNNALM